MFFCNNGREVVLVLNDKFVGTPHDISQRQLLGRYLLETEEKGNGNSGGESNQASAVTL